MSSPHKVFLVPEIVGVILGHVNQSDLFFNCPLVCKMWKEVIERVTEIQEALFLKPIPQKSLVPGTPYVHNQLLARYFSAFLTSAEPGPCLSPRIKNPEVRVSDYSYWKRFLSSNTYGGIWYPGKGSWREMLVTQPPITKVMWNIKTDNEIHAFVEMRFPEGLRFGVLFDILLTVGAFDAPIWPTRWSPEEREIKPDDLDKYLKKDEDTTLTVDDFGAIIIDCFNCISMPNAMTDLVDACSWIGKYDHLVDHHVYFHRFETKDTPVSSWLDQLYMSNRYTIINLFMLLQDRALWLPREVRHPDCRP
ncbi:hypothetical protein K449DRAFT_440818 [Hypoxylon sp. EC38]|nr:hypothetical protein K449DRAFT_440818 [Hypoxylon sp. EC38]